VGHKREHRGTFQITDVHLQASRISYSPMQEVNALDHWLNERDLFFKPTIDHLETGVPMRKISIELKLRELACEVDCSPDVLKDGRAMGLDIERHGMPDRSLEDGFNQLDRLVVFLISPPDVERKALKAGSLRLFSQAVGIGRVVNTPASTHAESVRAGLIQKR
jgi:hypothetical protein